MKHHHRRLTGPLYRTLLGVLAFAVAAAMVLASASPAQAHSGAGAPPPLTNCVAATQLKTPCSPTVASPSAGSYTVLLPGVGTLDLTVNQTTGAITAAAVSGLNAQYTASTPVVSANKKFVTVRYTNTTTGKVYYVSARTSAPASAGAAPKVSAIAGSRPPHHCGGGGRGVGQGGRAHGHGGPPGHGDPGHGGGPGPH